MLSTQAAPQQANKSLVPDIVQFYERRVLPVLFERLDRAFPEFHWTRTDQGWKGRLPENVDSGLVGSDRVADNSVRCRQPWGFTDASGIAVSWLAYVGGESALGNGDLIAAVRDLARRASVDESLLSGLATTQNREATRDYERQRQLQEAFVAYCHLQLCSSDGHAALEYLQRVHGINGHETLDFPLGLYTSADDVNDYLRRVGFSDAEINFSRVVRDVRLARRVIIPWRDRWGNIRTVVAHDASGKLSGVPRQLYRKCDATDDAFGLDVALRTSSGGLEHMILVEGLLDVVYFQTHGLTNVAAFGGQGKVPTSQQWERLADHGIRQVTLAMQDDEVGWERTLAALGNSYQARKSPQVFALAPSALGSARGAATFSRLNGIGRLRNMVAQRFHGFHFIADALTREYKDGGRWTDAGLMDLLHDAIEFDARVFTGAREVELERFFWPTILEAVGARWEAVRELLRRPLAPVQVREDAPRVQRPRSFDRRQPAISINQPQVVDFTNEAHEVTAPRAVAIDTRQSDALPVDVVRLAYDIWERKGRPGGLDRECWEEAMEIIRSRQKSGERIYARTA